MVKIEVNPAPEKKSLGFPKLMKGIFSENVYLAVSKTKEGAYCKINAILLKGPDYVAVGTRNDYPEGNLQDFDGSITLRNE